MKHRMNVVVLSCLGISCAAVLNSCGGSDADDSSTDLPTSQAPTTPATAATPQAVPPTTPASVPASGPQGAPNPDSLGAVNFSCGDYPSQQQQISYQPQQQTCKKGLYFEDHKFSNLDVKLDCDGGVVHVQNKGSADHKSKSFPIGADGKFQGKLQFQQQILGDDSGYGQNCWVEYVVQFGGKANCDDPSQKILSLKTAVKFNKTDSEHLYAAGIPTGLPEGVETGAPIPFPSPSPSASPSLCPAPSPSASPTPCPSPSASPSDTPGVVPSAGSDPWPHATVVPVVVCDVPEENCDYGSSTDLTCPN